MLALEDPKKAIEGHDMPEMRPIAITATGLPNTFPALHPAQQMVVDSDARFRVVNFGRQAGKTTLGKRLVAEEALKGHNCAYIVPLYRTLTNTYEELKADLGPRVVGGTAGERLILDSGGIIEFWSLHNGADRARGRIYWLDVFDECAMVPGIQAMWEAVWRPTLARHRGRAVFFSTPRRGGGFQKLYELGGVDPDWASWTIDTSANPFLAPEEIEAMRRGMSKQRFAQEVLADFEAAESELVYPNFRLRPLGSQPAHVGVPPIRWADCPKRIFCLDPGGGDPTAGYFMGMSEEEKIYVYAPEFYKRGGVPIPDMVDWISRASAEAQAVVVGETGGASYVATMRQLGIRAERASLTPDDNREFIRWLLDENRLMVDPRCEEMIAEFGLWRWRIKSDPFEGDTYVTSMTGDRHADAMSALGYGGMRFMRDMRAARPVLQATAAERNKVR